MNLDGAASSTAADGRELAATLQLSPSSSPPQPQPPPLPEDHGRGWEMVADGTSASTYAAADCSVFPPSLHEGLHLSSHSDRHPDPAGVVDDGPPLSRVREEGEGNLPSWMQVSETAKRLIVRGIEVINSRILICRGGRRVNCMDRGRVWSFAAAVAGLIGALMYVRRRQTREKELLFLLIQEKDQRISDLLKQIALLSEILAAHHQVSTAKRL